MKILVINGPNINLLGIREPDIYGKEDYTALLKKIGAWSAELGLETECFQSNHEGAIVDAIQAALGHYDGIVINPAAYTHTSIAIPDALRAVGIPAAEVHLSDILKREPFRRVSYTASAVEKRFMGLGPEGYHEALRYLKERLTEEGNTERREKQ